MDGLHANAACQPAEDLTLPIIPFSLALKPGVEPSQEIIDLVNRTINEKRFNLTRPLATDTAALRAIVQNVMKDEVRQFDSISITVTTDSTTALVFSSTVTSNTSSAGNTTTRTYQLVITLRQR